MRQKLLKKCCLFHAANLALISILSHQLKNLNLIIENFVIILSSVPKYFSYLRYNSLHIFEVNKRFHKALERNITKTFHNIFYLLLEF